MSSKTKHRHRHEIETKNLAPVNEAVKEYRVIEDGAYAYHLQNEEIENHYSQNVNMRRTVMDDIRRAKELQDEEDRKARILTLDEEKEIKQMDEELAEIIQEEIFQKSVLEDQEKKEREERDIEIALLMEEKERRRVERSQEELKQDQAIAARMQRMNVTPSPPSSRDETRMRQMTDEELAKRLQEEEEFKADKVKQRKHELKTVVQMQDEELAKYIHDREVEAAEMRFGKERSKRKSKKKGKYDDEPCYYDDNINPPNFYELHGKHPGDQPQRHPRDHQQHPSGEYQPRPSGNYPPRPSEQPNRSQADHHSQRHSKDKKPERPPPPRFSESHNTEIKVPLDQTQRERRHDHHESERRHPGHDRNSPINPDSRHAYSERNKKHQGSADSLDMDHPQRSYSERQNHRNPQDGSRSHGHSRSHPSPEERIHRDERLDPRTRNSDHSRSNGGYRHDDRHRRTEPDKLAPLNCGPVPKPRSNTPKSQPDPDIGDDEDELQYSENFARLTEEEMRYYNNNNNPANQKGKKKNKGECKQQ